jgi:hypothetical protein
MIKVNYFLRKPVYPIICNINNNLIGAKNKNAFERAIAKYDLNEKDYDIIDRTGEGWSFNTHHMIISPLTLKKSWTKKEIINLYNNSNDIINIYSEKSISNKRYYEVFDDLVDLIMDRRSQKGKNKSK